MATKPSNHRKNAGTTSNAMQTSDPPTHFFRIIRSPRHEQLKLKIPKKFGKKYGNELCEAVATITVPNGSTWKMGVQKAEGRVLFVDGWKDFAQHHLLDYGHFLVFRYEGLSKFHVIIFDKTATEIDYPSSGLRSDVEPNIDNHSSKRKMLCEKATSGKCKVAKMSKKHKLEEKANQVGLGDANISVAGKVKIENSMSPIDKERDEQMFISRMRCTSKRNVMSKESEMAFLAAKICKHTHPCFLILLTHHNISKCYADVPSKFVAKYMKICPEFIKVEAFNGKQWRMKCIPKNCCGTAKRMTRMGAFRNDNNLKEGDICVFELINQKDIVLRASIYHAADYADPVNECLEKEL